MIRADTEHITSEKTTYRLLLFLLFTVKLIEKFCQESALYYLALDCSAILSFILWLTNQEPGRISCHVCAPLAVWIDG